MNPLISILIPAYNAERWIGDTLRSALAQTWVNKEIIVVDDGSADGTLATAQRFAASGVKVVTQKNAGAAAARNKAFSLCQGDYVQWLDADDLLAPDKIARQMEVARQCRGNRTLLSSGWAYFYHRHHKARFVPTPLWHDLTPLEWLLRKWENNVHMQTGTWLVSRELTELAGPWDTRMLVDDDGEYFFRVVQKSDAIRFVDNTGVYYRVTPAARLSYIGRSDKKLNAQFFGMKRQIGYLREMADNARVRAACVTYLQTWLIYFYPYRKDIVQEAQQLAAELGGWLRPPELSWKYRWIQRTLGWAAATRAQMTYNVWKATVLRSWDGLLSRLKRGFVQRPSFSTGGGNCNQTLCQFNSSEPPDLK